LGLWATSLLGGHRMIFELFTNTKVLEIINSKKEIDLGEGLSIQYEGITHGWTGGEARCLEFAISFEKEPVGYLNVGDEHFDGCLHKPESFKEECPVLTARITTRLTNLFNADF